MHLATNHPRPNAFGDESSPAKCIWRQSTPYQVGLNRYDSAPLHSKFEDRNPLANKASCWSTNSPGNVVTIDFRSQSQQHTTSCKFKWPSSDNCELFWQGRHIYHSPPTHYGLPIFSTTKLCLTFWPSSLVLVVASFPTFRMKSLQGWAQIPSNKQYGKTNDRQTTTFKLKSCVALEKYSIAVSFVGVKISLNCAFPLNLSSSCRVVLPGTQKIHGQNFVRDTSQGQNEREPFG